MRLISIVILLFMVVKGDTLNSCKTCHPIIYSEFENSMHKKSSVDKIHRAIWKRHPLRAKGEYQCAECHAPESKKDNIYQGIKCTTCHRIIEIEEHLKANKNIYETKNRTLYSAQKGMEDKKLIYKTESLWFGLIKRTKGSPYHDIDYRNKIFYNGKVCMGCHSHKRNSKGLDVCRTDIRGVDRDKNCITCHMPKVKGSATTIRISDKHAFHGFLGLFNNPKLLSRYIDLSYKRINKGFSITIHNKTPHNLLLHPLRVLKLKTILKRGGEVIELKEHTFKRVIGRGGKPSMPWLADSVLEDTTIKALKSRDIKFNIELQSGDEIESYLGFYIVNPKVIKKIGLEKEKDLVEFNILKYLYIRVK